MYGAHTNAYRSKLDLAVKGQMSMYDHHFSNLVDLPTLMICAKFQPQGILGSGEEDF